jgi:hypothetical protein
MNMAIGDTIRAFTVSAMALHGIIIGCKLTVFSLIIPEKTRPWGYKK